MQMDSLVLLDSGGEFRLALHPDGSATIALQSEGEGGREMATARRVTPQELRALAVQAGRLATEGMKRLPKPPGCAVAQGFDARRCRSAEAPGCRCALERHGI